MTEIYAREQKRKKKRPEQRMIITPKKSLRRREAKEKQEIFISICLSLSGSQNTAAELTSFETFTTLGEGPGDTRSASKRN